MRKCSAMLMPLLLLVSSCAALGPNYQRPEMDLPQTWGPENAARAVADWRVFNDPQLLQLIEEAYQYNADIALAAARIDEARALLGIADSDRYPAISASADRARTRQSQVGSMPLPPETPAVSNSTRLTLNASYELDLWGKFRRASEAARAELLASEAARDTVRLTLATQVAQSYFLLLSLDAQADATRRTIAARRETQRLQQLRFDAGVISEYELRQIEGELAAALAQLPNLERQRAQQENALAALLGRSPREIVTAGVITGTASTPTAVLIPAGLPSDLLLRRPDIRQAEQRLIAANARIGVARAGYFPSISLTGYLGTESSSLRDLFSGPAGIFQFAAGLVQPIFQADRVGYRVDAARAVQRQAIAQYRQAVSNAFRDVQDALVGQQKSLEVLNAERARIVALEQARKLAKLRYDNGITSLLEVLDAERNLLQAQLNYSEAVRAQQSAVADLFKALGGGFVNQDYPPPSEPL